MSPPVGLVIGTKTSNPLEFWVGVSPGQFLQLDDVVVVRSALPDGLVVTFYGLVDTVEKSLEGLEFDSDNHLVQAGVLPVSLSHVARVTITRIEPEYFVPPHPGQAVHRAEQGDFATALFFDRMEYTIPAGIMRNGQVALLNYEFINGTKGGHVSISGVSGVATKTSYTLFLLHGIFHARSLRPEHRNSVRALIFNLKGEDLFFIDKPNARLSPEDLARYEQLGLPAVPFPDVKFFAPSRSGAGQIVVDTESRADAIQAYGWNLWQIADQELFRFLFAEDAEAASNLNYLIDRITGRLKFLAGKSRAPELTDTNNRKLRSLQDLKDYWQEILEEDEDLAVQWFGKNTPQNTVAAFMRRFEAAALHLRPLIRPDIRAEHGIQWADQKVTLIDINKLHARAKLFVVGATLKQLFKEKESQGSYPTVFVILDELNRYAGRNRWSPLKDILLDIAERGRSLGIILIGAQQTASEIERRIIANAAIKVNGRLDAAESSSKEYDHLTGTFRKRSLMVKPGTMIVHQPELPSPLLVNYPFCAWATRKSEVPATADSGEDPFDSF